MTLDNEAALVETILFLEAEPIDPETISRITKLSKEVILESIEYLKDIYNQTFHGLEVIELAGGFILAPKKEFWDNLKHRYGKKNDNKLSKAALETLSIIAYSQPITRQEIENIRGVSADAMIKLLSSKDLIKEVGKKDTPGKPIQYGTTKEFLKVFHLGSISELPKLDDLELDRFELEEK